MQANKHLSFGDSQNITLTKSKYNLQSKYNFGASQNITAPQSVPRLRKKKKKTRLKARF